MASQSISSGDIEKLRSPVRHPIIDGDGHFREVRPLLLRYVEDIGGKAIASRFAEAPLRSVRQGKAIWGQATENPRDYMTSYLPKLQYQRAEELGLDYLILYPTMGLGLLDERNDEMRSVLARALNTYVSEAFSDYRDRLEPVAVVPLHSPGEALAELEYTVNVLGFKAIVSSGVIKRSKYPDGRPGPWLDAIGYNSAYDYDPFWARCASLGITPAFHGIGWGWGTHESVTNYTADHIGSFIVSQEGVCRSLLMGGVTKRFPQLRFIFLEGGIGWAAQLYADALGHYSKRNKVAVQRYNPTNIDLGMCKAIFELYATGRIKDVSIEWEMTLRRYIEDAVACTTGQEDDFADSLISSERDIVDIFDAKLFFGCEADDPLNPLAFNRTMAPYDIQLNAVFSSDIGHWDVPDMQEVVPEAWAMVEAGRLSSDDFRKFTFENVARMYTAGNPKFFEGTSVADKVRELINSSAAV